MPRLRFHYQYDNKEWLTGQCKQSDTKWRGQEILKHGYDFCPWCPASGLWCSCQEGVIIVCLWGTIRRAQLEGYPLGWEVYPVKLRWTRKTGQDRGMSPDWERLAAAAKSLQSCPTLYNPIDGSPPGSSIHGIFQARVLEWVAIAFSRNVETWRTRYWTHVSSIGNLKHWTTREVVQMSLLCVLCNSCMYNLLLPQEPQIFHGFQYNIYI